MTDFLDNAFNGVLDDLFKPLADALTAGFEQIALATQCKMRRFYLVRSVDTDGTGIIAEGVVFEDGIVALRWRTTHKSTAIYESIAKVEAIHGHRGKTVVKYIDAEQVA